MKILKLFVLICCCFSSLDLFAQTPAVIEADLLKSIKKVTDESPSDLYDTTKNTDSLDVADDLLRGKLLYYTSKYPFTLIQRFKSLDSTGLGIHTSADKLFRIYSWNTGLGGTQQDYTSIIQYKTRQGGKSILVGNDDPNIKTPFYDTIYILKRNGKVYYFAIYSAVMDLHERTQGVQIFSIENDTLNDKVKLIKTKTGMHSRLEYDYNDNFIYGEQQDPWPEIIYDEKLATLKIPVVLESGEANGNYITYKFTGKYFEKVKP